MEKKKKKKKKNKIKEDQHAQCLSAVLFDCNQKTWCQCHKITKNESMKPTHNITQSAISKLFTDCRQNMKQHCPNHKAKIFFSLNSKVIVIIYSYL